VDAVEYPDAALGEDVEEGQRRRRRASQAFGYGHRSSRTRFPALWLTVFPTPTEIGDRLADVVPLETAIFGATWHGHHIRLGSWHLGVPQRGEAVNGDALLTRSGDHFRLPSKLLPRHRWRAGRRPARQPGNPVG